jgi:HSP20 family protein
MSKAIAVKKKETIFDEMRKMQDLIMERAYNIFETNGRALGRDLENWLDAERQLVWKPAIELRETDGEFHVSIAVPGVDPKAIDIEATEDYLLVKAEVHHEHDAVKDRIHTCEFESGNLFRSVCFPKKINPDKVKAEFKNGMLRLTAELAAEAKTRKISVTD